MPIIYNENDLASACGPTVACSPNGLGANTVTGRSAAIDQPLGVGEVTVTVAANEQAAIYAMFEIVPGARVTWSSGDVLLNFNVTTRNPNVDWVRTDLCHVTAACTSVETLASNTAAVNLGPSEVANVLKLITGFVSATVPIVTGDKVLILLSFSNTTGAPQTFGWTPNQTITLPWLDRGFEIVAHMAPGRSKARSLLPREPVDVIPPFLVLPR